MAWLSTTEAAELLGISTRQLARWRELEVDGAPAAPACQPGGPRGPISWRAEELEGWRERLSAWHRRRHLRMVQGAPDRPAASGKRSLFARAAEKLRR